MIKTISVTEEEINNGKEYNCSFCPIALALKKLIDSKYLVSVTIGWFRIALKEYEEEKYIVLPKEAGDFIRIFDRALYKPNPIKFEVDIPEKYLIKVE